MSYLVPTVIEQSPKGERAYDIYSAAAQGPHRGARNRDQRRQRQPAHRPALHLEADDPDKDISLYINSPGGSVTATLGIYDTMQVIAPDVSTVCVGMAASGAAVLLAGGAPGKRLALPNARVLIHQPHGGAQGQSIDIENQAREIAFLRGRLEEILAHHTGPAPGPDRGRHRPRLHPRCRGRGRLRAGRRGAAASPADRGAEPAPRTGRPRPPCAGRPSPRLRRAPRADRPGRADAPGPHRPRAARVNTPTRPRRPITRPAGVTAAGEEATVAT